MNIKNHPANVLFNFIENKNSNVECLLIIEYDVNLINFLDCNISSFQKHVSFESFLNSELKEEYQFIDLQDIKVIDEANSLILFQRIRGKVKIIVYDSYKKINANVFKNCNWLRLLAL